jgi:hypothetical protein
MSAALVADIGGSKSRFGLANGAGWPERIVVIENDTVADLETAVTRYLKDTGARPRTAVMAIAGPIQGEEIALTNRAWRFRRADFAARFGFSQLHIVNDFEAVAWALPRLTAAHTRRLGPGALREEGVKVVLGPGTGLGVAALLPADGRLFVVASEVTASFRNWGLYACLQPSEGVTFLSAPEDLDFGMRKVLSNLGYNFQDRVVRDSSYAVDLAMVIVHEFHVLDERTKAVPPRKGWRFDQQSSQLPFFTDVGVDHTRNLAEIISRKGALRLDEQHTGILQKLELDHGRTPFLLSSRSCPPVPADTTTPHREQSLGVSFASKCRPTHHDSRTAPSCQFETHALQQMSSSPPSACSRR